MLHSLTVGGQEVDIELARDPSSDGYRLSTGDGRFMRVASRQGVIEVDGRLVSYQAARYLDKIFIHMNGQTFELDYIPPVSKYAINSGASADDALLAPMPGTVVSVEVEVGDYVEQGQSLIVIESMKLETTLKSPRDGNVEDVHFALGASFDRDAVLLSLEKEVPNEAV